MLHVCFVGMRTHGGRQHTKGYFRWSLGGDDSFENMIHLFVR